MSVTREPGYQPIYQDHPKYADWAHGFVEKYHLDDIAAHGLDMGNLGIESIDKHIAQWPTVEQMLNRKTEREQTARLVKQIAEPREPIDLDELAEAPIIKFGDGFTSAPPPDCLPGEEPPLAPMSSEQMRLLFVRVLGRNAPEVVPFIEENVIFRYDAGPAPRSGAVPPGPRVEQVNYPVLDRDGHPTPATTQKIVVTLNYSHFITRGLPPHGPGTPQQKELNQYMWGFVDPSKIIMVLGKIVGRMTLPIDPRGPGGLTPNGQLLRRLIPDQNFHATADKDSQGNYLKDFFRLPTKKEIVGAADTYLGAPAEAPAPNLVHQWEDFVGLYLALPEQAKIRYPAAYEYLREQLQQFTDPTNDAAARSRLVGFGNIKSDFKIVADLRSDEEISSVNPPSPERHFLDYVYDGLNTVLAPFGTKLSFRLPEDEERAELLAKDNEEITRLVEHYDQDTRDKEFGEILALYPPDDKQGRNLARRYLIATSKDGHFSEWRVFAWLYKFSHKFRNPDPGRKMGSEISEEDYLDLKLIYDAAEESGRYSASTLPYDKKTYKRPNSARTLHYYEIVPPKKYQDRLRAKMARKNARGIWDIVARMEEKAFVEFDPTHSGDYIDYDAPVSSAFLTQYIPNAAVADAISDALKQVEVNRVSADTKALAEAYYRHFRANNEQINDYMTTGAVNTVLHYKEDLNRPVDVDEFIKQAPPDLVKRAGPEYIAKRQKETDEERKAIIGSLVDQINAAPLAEYTQDQLRLLVNNDHTNVQIIRAQTNRFLDTKRAEKGDEVDKQKREAFAFLSRDEVKRNLKNLRKILRYQESIEPLFAVDIKEVADSLKKVEEIKNLIAIGDTISKEEYEEKFEPYNIVIEPADQERIDNMSKEYGALLPPTHPAIGKMRAEIVKEKLLHMNDQARMLFAAGFVSESLKDFKKNVQLTPTAQNFNKWKERHPILKSEALTPIATQLEGVVAMIEGTSGGARNRYEKRLTEITDNMAVALQQIQLEFGPKPKSAPAPAADSGGDSH